MPKYPPTMKLRKKEACAYLNCGSTTFDNYVKAGTLKHVDSLPSDPRVKFYLVSDLNSVKSKLGPRTGKRLSKEKALTIENFALTLPDVPGEVSVEDNRPLSEIDSVEARLMEAAGMPSTITMHKAQQMLRQHILLKAIHSKVVDKLFNGLNSLDERVVRNSVRDILSLILPQLKTVETVKVESDESRAMNEETKKKLEKIHQDILKSRHPTIDTEFRVIDIEETNAQV